MIRCKLILFGQCSYDLRKSDDFDAPKKYFETSLRDHRNLSFSSRFLNCPNPPTSTITNPHTDEYKTRRIGPTVGLKTNQTRWLPALWHQVPPCHPKSSRRFLTLFSPTYLNPFHTSTSAPSTHLYLPRPKIPSPPSLKPHISIPSHHQLSQAQRFL